MQKLYNYSFRFSFLFSSALWNNKKIHREEQDQMKRKKLKIVRRQFQSLKEKKKTIIW